MAFVTTVRCVYVCVCMCVCVFVCVISERGSRLFDQHFDIGFFIPKPGMEKSVLYNESYLNCDSVTCSCDSMPGWKK